MNSAVTLQQAVQALNAAADAQDDAASQEWATFIQQTYPDYVKTLQAPQTPSEPLTGDMSYVQGVGRRAIEGYSNTLTEASEGFSDIIADAPEYSADTTTLRAISEAVQLSAGLALDSVAATVPEAVSKGFITGSQAGLEWLGEQPWVAPLISAAKRGAEAFNRVKQSLVDEGYLNQEDLDRFGAMVDVAAIATPSTKVGPLTDPLAGLGDRLKDLAASQTGEARRNAVTTMVRPKKFYEGGWDVQEQPGFFTPNEPIPPTYYEGVIETLADTPEINPGRSYHYNQGVLRDKIKETAEQLRSDLISSGNPTFNRQRLIQNLLELRDNVENIEGLLGLTGDSVKLAERAFDVVIDRLQSTGPTVINLWDARKNFDKAVDEISGGFDNQTAKGRLMNLFRDTINEEIITSASSVDVADSFQRMSHYFTARPVFQQKAQAEAESRIGRLMANIQRTGNLPRTPLALYATASVAWPFLPQAAAGAAVGGTVIGAVQLSRSAALKNFLGDTLKLIDDAIKTTDNSDMVTQLKADRLFLIEITREALKDEEESDGDV